LFKNTSPKLTSKVDPTTLVVPDFLKKK